MKATPIPTRSRRLVVERERGRCARCSGVGAEWHHRRSRSVRDAHMHCPCNGVWLCGGCHRWAHANPEAARETGFVVSRHVTEPGTVPFKALSSWVHPDCEGGYLTTGQGRSTT